MKVFEPSVNNFDIIRNDLILKYGTKNENGNFEIAKNDAEAIKNFNSEIEKIANEDIYIIVPKIKADEVFKKLQVELTGTEDKIAFARQFYNDCVQKYNTTIEVFPTATSPRTTTLYVFKYSELFVSVSVSPCVVIIDYLK